MRKCKVCEMPDPTASYREVKCAVLCAACNVDASTSSTVRLTVKDVREHNDRYSRMAERYGVS